MDFGAYLESCIRKRNLSINALSRECNINRGGLYSVFKQQRKLKEDQLFNLIAKIGLTPVESEKLANLFFKDLYGEEEFEKLMLLMQWIQTPLSVEDASEEKDLAKAKVIHTLQDFLEENSTVATNFPLSFENIDVLFYRALKKNSLSAITHILYFDEKGDYKHNYSSIFKSLKYMYLQQFPYYCWKTSNASELDALMPYFAIGEHTAVLFSKSAAITLRDGASVQTLLDSAQKQISQCRPLGYRPTDIMQIKDSYQKGIVRSGHIIEIKSYLCVAPFADHEIMQSVVKPELPNKDALVEIAFSHYKNLFASVEYTQFTTENGLIEFAHTGKIEEIPNAFVNTLDVPHRIRILKNIVQAISENKLYIFDKSKISIPLGFSIEKSINKVFINGSTPSLSEFFVSESFIAELDDLSFVNSLTRLAEYLIKSRKVCSKDYAVQFVNNIISGLECLK